VLLPEWAGVPPYLVLLRVGFALPAALLPRRCALAAPFHPYPAHSRNPAHSRRSICNQDASARMTGAARMSGAVCFLWHFPSAGLEPGVPDVIRHTALRSSDFPPRPFSKPSRFQGRSLWSRASEPTRLPEWAGRPSGPAAYHFIICDGACLLTF
jgi:hypothetical protein